MFCVDPFVVFLQHDLYSHVKTDSSVWTIGESSVEFGRKGLGCASCLWVYRWGDYVKGSEFYLS